MWNRGWLVWGVATLCLVAAPVNAELVNFSVGNTTMTYAAATHQATFGGKGNLTGSWDVGAQTVSSKFGDYTFAGSLTFTQLGVNNWSAAGSFALADKTATPRVAFDFASTSVILDNTKGSLYSVFEVIGTMSVTAPHTTILVGASSPAAWTFSGTSGGLSLPDNWWQLSKTGAMIDLQLFLATPLTPGHQIPNLDTFFASSRTGTGGQTTFSTVVPIPTAVLLGMLGLSAAGLGLRRFV